MRATVPPLLDLAPELAQSLILDEEAGILLLLQPRTLRPRLALGCAWALEPVNVEDLEEAECLDLARRHAHLFRTLPVGTSAQTLLLIEPATRLLRWEAQRQRHCVPEAYAPLVAAQRAAIATGLPHASGTDHGRLRMAHTLLTVRVPLDLETALGALVRTLVREPGNVGARLVALLEAHQAESLHALRGLARICTSTLREAGHTVLPLTGTALGRTLARFLQPWAPRVPAIVRALPLNEQVAMQQWQNIDGGWRVGTQLDEGFAEDWRCQVLGLHHAPPQTYPGMLSAPRAPEKTEPLHLWQAWDGPLAMAVNIAMVPKTQERQRIDRRRWLAARYSKKSPQNTELAKQLGQLAVDLFTGGGEIQWGRVHIVLWGQGAAAVREGVEAVRERCQRLQLEFALERGSLGSTLFLHTLPLGFDHTYPKESDLRRARRLTLDQLAHLSVLYGGMRGTKTAAVPYLNERGEEVSFFPFDSDTNPHFIVVGTSGAGKTYGTAHLIAHLVALGATVVIIDPLQNYRGLVESLDGSRLTISFDHPPCFNPFFGDLGPAHRSFISTILRQMAAGSQEALSWQEFNVLSAAVGYFATTWDPTRGEPFLELFVEEVLKTGVFAPTDRLAQRLGQRLALKLQLFYGTGPYAPFVNGPNTFRIRPGLTVIELADLKQAEDLRGILFFAMTHAFTRFFEDPQWQAVSKFLLFDEVWALDGHPETAHEVQRIVRTYRNIRTCAGFLSQRCQDFDTPMGQVIRGIAGQTLFLQQKSTELEKIRDLFELSPAQFQAVKRARKFAGWSRAYLQLENHQGGMVRLVPDRWLDLAMSQDPSTLRRRQEALAQHGSMAQAIRALLAEEGIHG